MVLKNKLEILQSDSTYHIYNRTNGSEKLFLSYNNYLYFIKKYSEYISPFADTFCYCLMPNHFHFLIRIKPEKDLELFFKNELIDLKNSKNLISFRFSNFFNAYAKAFNKMHNRKGSLFMHTFKRKKVEDIIYLRNLVQYIHLNPLEAGLCNGADQCKYSSYKALMLPEEVQTLEDIPILKREVIGWFEDTDNFKNAHLIKTLKIF